MNKHKVFVDSGAFYALALAIYPDTILLLGPVLGSVVSQPL